MDVTIIKEYLVSLGWEIDHQDLARFTQALKVTEKQVESHTSGVAKMFAVMAGTVVAAYAGIAAAAVGLTDNVAQADLGSQTDR